MRPLIENGMLYIATPPLYSIETGTKGKEYIATDEELEERKKTIKGNYKVQRFKGLGEMNADELYDTTMNPENRRLLRVNLTDAAVAEKRIHLLMGDQVEPRKEWINENVDFTLEDDFRR
jgi:topoisomerase-4 subunit B